MKQKLLVAGVGFVLVGLVIGAMLWPRSAKGPVVGVIVAETGESDFIGRPERAVLEALEARLRDGLGGRIPFVLRIRDSGGSADAARAIFQDFVNDPDVIAVIGPPTSGESIAVADVADSSEVPLLSLAASKDIVLKPGVTPPTARRWVFKCAQNDDLAAARLLHVMAHQKMKRVALLYQGNGFGKSGAAVIRDAVNRTPGITIVHEVAFPPSLDRPSSFASAIPKDADAIVIWGTAPGPALLVQSVREAQLDAQIFLSHGNASRAFIDSAGPASEGCVVVGSRILLPEQEQATDGNRVLRDFRQLWNNAKIPGEPSQFGGYARDAYEMVLQAVTEGKASNRLGVRDHIERGGAFSGVTGTYRFSDRDHAGLEQDAFEVFRIDGGRFRPWSSAP